MSEVNINVEALKVEDVKEGDILIFRMDVSGLPRKRGEEYLRKFRDNIKERFSKNRIIVLPKNHEVEVVRSSEKEEEESCQEQI